MRPDQTQAAQHTGKPCWRAVYHHTEPDGQTTTETVTWFETTPQDATTEAAAQLPPPGYDQPHTITIEQGTFTPTPEGGHTWQPHGTTLTAHTTPDGLTLNRNTDIDLPAKTATDLATAGQQPLF